MVKVCPKPMQWASIYEELIAYAKLNNCTPPQPPSPLILAGWNYSNDLAKQNRWNKTVEWAKKNNCFTKIKSISVDDYYYVDELFTGEIGPLPGLKNSWNFKSKKRPTESELDDYIDKIKTKWKLIAGLDLAEITKPLKFTGKKARRLLVVANPSFIPPWGGWDYLSKDKEKRRIFTEFRHSVNEVIAPHEVDHISFTFEDHF